MTRSELIERIIARQIDLSPRVLDDAIKHIFDRMSKTLCAGNRIEIRGFGSFDLRYRPPRTARNPKTGEIVSTEGKYSPHFKPGKELKDRVCMAAANGIHIVED